MVTTKEAQSESVGSEQSESVSGHHRKNSSAAPESGLGDKGKDRVSSSGIGGRISGFPAPAMHSSDKRLECVSCGRLRGKCEK